MFFRLLASYKHLVHSIPGIHPVRNHPAYKQIYFSKHFFKRPSLFRLILCCSRSLYFVSISIFRTNYSFKRSDFNNITTLLLSSPVNSISTSTRHYSKFKLTESDLFLCGRRSLSPLSVSSSLPNHISADPGSSFFVEISLFCLSILYAAVFVVRPFIDKRLSFGTAVWDLYILFSSGVQNSVRYALTTVYLCSTTPLQSIVFTHEGHAWEYQLVTLINSLFPDIQLTAYIFSACFPDQPCFTYHQPNALPQPVSFLFSNSLSFKSYIRLGQDGIIQRPLAITLPFTTVKNNETPSISSSGGLIVLFAPEAFNSEIELLFDLFTLLCSSSLPITPIFRFHPDTDASYIRSLHVRNPSIVHLFDTDPLDESLSRSSFVIYRGSTVSVSASMYQTIPLYYDIGTLIDPLFLCTPELRYFSNIYSLEKLLLMSPSLYTSTMSSFTRSLL